MVTSSAAMPRVRMTDSRPLISPTEGDSASRGVIEQAGAAGQRDA